VEVKKKRVFRDRWGKKGREGKSAEGLVLRHSRGKVQTRVDRVSLMEEGRRTMIRPRKGNAIDSKKRGESCWRSRGSGSFSELMAIDQGGGGGGFSV